ncbi:MAG: hypothetical protein M3126_01660 [Candidatus Eremiobacteraeota bacterium]|nr:hypothetical protein [Candidatus Eremiobacteraeota bacterium]
MARLILPALVCFAALAASAPTFGAPARSARSCQVLDYTVRDAYPGMRRSPVVFRIYFANNNAVQMYSIVRTSQNAEADHAALVQLQKRYGLAFVNAPPLRILSFRKASSKLSVPDKAVDSCGRITRFK